MEEIERVELVRKKARVGWARAREALQAADGDVIGALAWLEAKEARWTERLVVQGEEVAGTISRLIEEGNVTRVIVKKEDRVLVDIPLTLTLVGVVLAPVLAILSAVVALGTRCTVEVERTGTPKVAPEEETLDEGSGEYQRDDDDGDD